MQVITILLDPELAIVILVFFAISAADWGPL